MNNYESDDDSYSRESAESPLGEEGCVFPGQCCMPGPHYTSECHTAEMLMALEEEAKKPAPTAKGG